MIIVGGGPGGAATAIICASRGLRVTLLELRDFPRDRPGETLHPGVEPLLYQLGVGEMVASAEFLRHTGQWVTWGNGSRFVPFGEDERGKWLGFQAWRADFDRLLMHRARSLGVEVLQPCRAIRPVTVERSVQGVRSERGELDARFVVDAAGGGHWLARKLGLRVLRFSPRLIAQHGYCEGECPERDAAPAIVADSAGWTWTAKVRPGLYQWTRLLFAGSPRDVSVPNEFRGLRPFGETRKSDVTWRTIPESAGEGYFLVGDAAAVLDPAASHGVLRALMSGIKVGHLICLALGYGVHKKLISASYREWMGLWFREDVRRLSELYDQLPWNHLTGHVEANEADELELSGKRNLG